MSNSTRQHPPKLQPSVHNCLCIKVKTEKSSKAWLSGSVQCACSHHQFTIQLALLPQLNARFYTVDSLCESEVISDRLRSRSPPLSLARSLSPLIQEHHFESSRAELFKTCLCGLHNKTLFVFTQTLPCPSVAMSAYCKRSGLFFVIKMLINMSSRTLCFGGSIGTQQRFG